MPPFQSQDSNTKAVIELRHIKKQYTTAGQAISILHDINLTVYQGEYVAIMGPSGSGKSTLMNIIGILDSPSGGTYHLDTTEITELEDQQLAQIRNAKIGFVFQSFNLLKRTSALDNVALPLIYAGIFSKTERQQRAYTALEAVGLGNKIQNKPNELSGGQQQRVSIARALVNTPSLILADEPTGALDTKTSEEVLEIFNQLHQRGNTIIMITHEPDVARHAQRIILLRDGAIVEDTLTSSLPQL